MNAMFPVRINPSRMRMLSARAMGKLNRPPDDRQSFPPELARTGDSMGGVTVLSTDRFDRHQPHGSSSWAPPRLRIDVPMGTSYREIQEAIFRQACEKAGTQVQAAKALGVTPNTISRVLRRTGRRQNRVTGPSNRLLQPVPVQLVLIAADEELLDGATHGHMEN